ncbi:MAG: glycogen synthase GlgA [Planctomycetaceae bacterium]|nr:glycogen synthase GlgA [Planctomycetaceae bacterium]
MNILFATSELVPFAKTGGLADVSCALPRALSRLGHKTCVIMPGYRKAIQSGQNIWPVGVDFTIPIWNKNVKGSLLESRLPNSDVPVYLVLQDQYYDRDGLYNQKEEDYSDNCERFVFFSRAVLEAIRLLGLEVDILHSNDWQTGLVPAYLEILYRSFQRYKNITSIHTIHNMAYQGVFWHWDMCLTGLDWKYFTPQYMEFYGKLNLLKTALTFADGITTVSPTYAKEIQTEEFGCALDGVLRFRRERLQGILNGVDTDRWNPATDSLISVPFDVNNVFEQKPLCKSALQREMKLPERENSPVIGIVGRLASQKGIDLVAEVMPKWVEEQDVQWVVLGTGDQWLEQRLQTLAERFPQNIAVKLTFCDQTAHRIEAGSDMFVMPSRYEPCGLNQMYSLIYGAIPIVHETGGLADTIVHVATDSLADETANGFRFRDADVNGLNWAIGQALNYYKNDRETWKKLILTGMKRDFSWRRSAQEYLDFYERRKESSVAAKREN